MRLLLYTQIGDVYMQWLLEHFVLIITYENN